MKTILMTICMLLLFHYCAYAEVSIKEYENGTFQVYENNKVLQSRGSNIEWLKADVHGREEYTFFNSLEEAQKRLEGFNKSITVVNETNFSNSSNVSGFSDTAGNVMLYSDATIASTGDIAGNIVSSDMIWSQIDGATIEVKKESKMSFIIDVFGANLLIFLISIFWIVGTFFTMKNVCYESYDDIKKYTNFNELDVFDFVCIIMSMLFPLVYAILGVRLFFHILVNHVFKNIFKFLDKVIPRVEFKIEKDNE